MKMFQVYFKTSYESKIIMAESRREIWKKYPDVQCMYRIDII